MSSTHPSATASSARAAGVGHAASLVHHILLAEGLDPRSRALHRALRRLTVVHRSTTYWVAAPETSPRAGKTWAWLARVFPNGQDLVAEMPTPRAQRPHRRRRRVRGRASSDACWLPGRRWRLWPSPSG